MRYLQHWRAPHFGPHNRAMAMNGKIHKPKRGAENGLHFHLRPKFEGSTRVALDLDTRFSASYLTSIDENKSGTLHARNHLISNQICATITRATYESIEDSRLGMGRDTATRTVIPKVLFFSFPRCADPLLPQFHQQKRYHYHPLR